LPHPYIYITIQINDHPYWESSSTCTWGKIGKEGKRGEKKVYIKNEKNTGKILSLLTPNPLQIESICLYLVK